MAKPLAIDLYAGLGGWTEGLLAEGWDVIGFDIERHRYPKRDLESSEAIKGMSGSNENGTTHMNYENEKRLRNSPLTGGWQEYPAQLVLMDTRQIHGAMFAEADLIVASPPCQEFSYRAMPWKRAKALPPPVLGTNLFWQCWRIQHEACEAAGRYIPMVVENVKGAQPWVGRARGRYGSFFLWGDVESVGGRLVRSGPVEFGMASVQAASIRKGFGGTWFHNAELETTNPNRSRTADDPRKVPGFNFHQHENGGKGGSFQSAAVKGMSSLRGFSHPNGGTSDLGGPNDPRRFGSKSSARKAASAQIARIPEPLSRHIGRVFKPDL